MPRDWSDLINQASKEFGVPADMIARVIAAESSGRPLVVSSAGAIGLMQVKPGTGRALGFTKKQLETPSQNIRAGTKYLKQMREQFGDWTKALAAYNAGPGAVRKHGGVPPYRETQEYVAKVLRSEPESGGWVYPVPGGGRITAGFGHLGRSHKRPHSGIDIAVPVGTEIVAMRPGRVTKVGRNGIYGNYVQVDEGGGVIRQYGHLSSARAAVGDTVGGGQSIALSGNTGRSTGPHLDVKKIVNGKAVDFMSELTGAKKGGRIAATVAKLPPSVRSAGLSPSPFPSDPKVISEGATQFDIFKPKSLGPAPEEETVAEAPLFDLFQPVSMRGLSANV